MLSSLQQLSNNSEGLSFIINLGGNSDNKLQLNISAAQARFIEINKYFNSKANDAVQVFSQEYPKAIKNLDNAIQKTYDLGLMQINISNIKGGEETEKMYLFNTKINSLYGAAILQQCFGKFKNVNKFNNIKVYEICKYWETRSSQVVLCCHDISKWRRTGNHSCLHRLFSQT